MTLYFFILTLFSGWIAYNLYHPAMKPRILFIISWMFSYIVAETAPYVIMIQIAGFLIFAFTGAIQGFLGFLGVVIALLSWVAMIRHYRTSFHANKAIETAIIEALGQDYRQDVEIPLRKYFSDTLDIGVVAKFWRVDREDVERVKNIIYDTKDGMNLKLDIYRHQSKPQNCPVLLQIHGGAWLRRMGSKNEQARPLMNHLAARGWVSVSVGYRLSPKATFPEHIIDCKKAFAWVKEHIKEYGGNPDFIVVTGGSAGGHLSSLIALSANDPAFQPGFEDVDTRVQGCVPFYGVYDFADTHGLQKNPDLYRVISLLVMKKSKKRDPEAYKQASPLHRINEDAPPFLIIQGENDTLIPAPEPRKFAQLLKETSKNPVGYAEIKGAQHLFDLFPSVRSEYVKLGIERFVNTIYDKWLKQKNVDITILHSAKDKVSKAA